MSNAMAVIRRRVALPALLAALAFALGHQIVYVVQYGTNAGYALARTGHDGQWTLAVATIVVLAAALVVTAAVELRRLGRQAGSVKNPAASRASLFELARSVLTLFLVVLVVSLAAFLVVENLEYASSGLQSPGMTLLLSPVHQDTLIVFELVSIAVALVAGLYRWRRDILVELIALANRNLARQRPQLWSKWPVATRARTAIVRALPPGRAPPLAAFA